MTRKASPPTVERRVAQAASGPRRRQGDETREVPALGGTGDALPADPMRQVVERVRQITVENERLFHELIAGERRFRGLARSVWRVQEAERRRLARDLHDGIGQTLTALKQQLELVAQRAVDLPPDVQARLADARGLATQALADTRELSRLLRPQILDDLGLEPALRWLTRTFQERSGVDTTLDLLTGEGEPAARASLERLAPELETLVFRLVQEALNNVAKHAQASAAWVRVARQGSELRVEVGDDGRGFDAAAPRGMEGSGLTGMRDRVELFGGRIEIASQPGHGTRITATLPGEGAEP